MAHLLSAWRKADPSEAMFKQMGNIMKREWIRRGEVDVYNWFFAEYMETTTSGIYPLGKFIEIPGGN